jgi:hypothetical protein
LVEEMIVGNYQELINYLDAKKLEGEGKKKW